MQSEDISAGSVHPRFLKSQCQIHAEWILGAFVEIIHNAYDAKANLLCIEVTAEMGFVNPRLNFIDNGIYIIREVRKIIDYYFRNWNVT